MTNYPDENMLQFAEHLLDEIDKTVSFLESVNDWSSSPFVQVRNGNQVGVIIGNQQTGVAAPVIWDIWLKDVMSFPLNQWRILRSFTSLRQLANEGWRIDQ